jgi:hypothetical protein
MVNTNRSLYEGNPDTHVGAVGQKRGQVIDVVQKEAGLWVI